MRRKLAKLYILNKPALLAVSPIPCHITLGNAFKSVKLATSNFILKNDKNKAQNGYKLRPFGLILTKKFSSIL